MSTPLPAHWESMVRNVPGRPEDWDFLYEYERNIWLAQARQKVLDGVVKSAESEVDRYAQDARWTEALIGREDRKYGRHSIFPEQVNRSYWEEVRPGKVDFLEYRRKRHAEAALQLKDVQAEVNACLGQSARKRAKAKPIVINLT